LDPVYHRQINTPYTRNALNMRPGVYLIFEDPGLTLIRRGCLFEGRLFKNMPLTLS